MSSFGLYLRSPVPFPSLPLLPLLAWPESPTSGSAPAPPPDPAVMDDYAREMMELKTLVTRTLEKKGVLAKIRVRTSPFLPSLP